MSKSDLLENALLALIFNATTIPKIAEDLVVSPATTLTVALHTSDPGEAGNQTTNEATYGNYVRKAVNRDSGGWTITNDSVSPQSNIEFAQASSGSETVTHFSIGTGTSDNMLYSGTVTPNIVVTTGVTPILTTASAITEA